MCLIWRDDSRFISAHARTLNGEFGHRQQSTRSGLPALRNVDDSSRTWCGRSRSTSTAESSSYSFFGSMLDAEPRLTSLKRHTVRLCFLLSLW